LVIPSSSTLTINSIEKTTLPLSEIVKFNPNTSCLHSKGSKQTWNYIKTNWNDMYEEFKNDPFTLSRTIGVMGYLPKNDSDINEMVDFFENKEKKNIE